MSERKNAVQVDKDNLDELWEEQPYLYLQWSERQANAVLERDRLKDNLALVYADLDAAIRRKPKKYGLSDTRETAIKSAILRQPEYKKAADSILRANKEVNILNGMLESLSHKKKALEKLTELWLAGYWGEPRIRGAARSEFDKKRSEERVSSLNNAMKIAKKKRRVK